MVKILPPKTSNLEAVHVLFVTYSYVTALYTLTNELMREGRDIPDKTLSYWRETVYTMYRTLDYHRNSIKEYLPKYIVEKGIPAVEEILMDLSLIVDKLGEARGKPREEKYRILLPAFLPFMQAVQLSLLYEYISD